MVIILTNTGMNVLGKCYAFWGERDRVLNNDMTVHCNIDTLVAIMYVIVIGLEYSNDVFIGIFRGDMCVQTLRVPFMNYSLVKIFSSEA